MEKIRNEKDFLSEAEMINVMGGTLGPCTEWCGWFIKAENGCLNLDFFCINPYFTEI